MYEPSEAIAAREEAIKSHIYKDDLRKMFACDLCHFGASSRYKAFCHIEAGVWSIFHLLNVFHNQSLPYSFIIHFQIQNIDLRIEAKHYKDDSITYTCKLCGKSASSRNALGSHMTREHREEKYSLR